MEPRRLVGRTLNALWTTEHPEVTSSNPADILAVFGKSAEADDGQETALGGRQVGRSFELMCPVRQSSQLDEPEP